MVNFVECFRQIDCTDIYRVTFAHVVANNITYSIYSISATHTFLKAELIIWRFKIWLIFFKETVFKYFRQEWTYGNTTKYHIYLLFQSCNYRLYTWLYTGMLILQYCTYCNKYCNTFGGKILSILRSNTFLASLVMFTLIWHACLSHEFNRLT